MALIKTRGVNLGSIDFGESDRIVAFFTADMGKLRAIAKGAKRSKKRFGVNLDTFSLVELYLTQRARSGLPMLQGCDLIDPFLAIRQSLERISLASYMVELASSVATEGEANPGLFQLLVSALSTVDQGKGGAGLTRLFELKLLTAAGLAPEFKSCLACRREIEKKNRVAFSPSKGGVLCPACLREGGPFLLLSPETVTALQDAQELPWEAAQLISFPPLFLKEAQEALRLFLRFHLGKELRSQRFSDSVLLPSE